MNKLFLILSLFFLTNVFANYQRVNNIVIDKELSLVWQDDKFAKITKMSLDNSKKHCENLSLNSKTNWRLPTYEELLSIGDYEIYKPTIHPIFKNTASGHYWSIIYKRVAYGDSWKPLNEFYVKRIYFSDGFSYDNDRTGKAYVRCVRDDS